MSIKCGYEWWQPLPQSATTLFSFESVTYSRCPTGMHKMIKKQTAHRVRVHRGSSTLRLNARDKAIVQWVYSAHLATREQIQRLLFTSGGRSRCQDRLTQLFRHRYLDRLSNRLVNQPDVYMVSKKAVKGLRLLRSWSTHPPIKPFRVAPSRVSHLLEIADIRITFSKVPSAQGVHLLFWMNEEAVKAYTEPFGIVPDAYFQISRVTSEGEKRSAFFVEVERSAKPGPALEQKFSRYREFYYQGHYEATFGTKALRVLYLIGSDYDINPQRKIATLRSICKKLGVTFIRFANLQDFSVQEPAELLSSRIWYQVQDDGLSGLF